MPWKEEEQSVGYVMKRNDYAMRKVSLILLALLFSGCCFINREDYEVAISELEAQVEEQKTQIEELESKVVELESERDELEEENDRLRSIIEDAPWEFERGNYRNGMWHLEEL